jgi:hypothetical protein
VTFFDYHMSVGVDGECSLNPSFLKPCRRALAKCVGNRTVSLRSRCKQVLCLWLPTLARPEDYRHVGQEREFRRWELPYAARLRVSAMSGM